MNKIKYILKDLFLSNLKRIYKNYKYINNTTIIGKSRLENVIIKNYCSFADNSFIVNSNISDYTSVGRNSTIINATIGKFCSISWNVTVGATKHYTDRISTHAFPYIINYGFCDKDDKIIEPVIVGNDVWIGANAIIMPNIRIGSGSVIGANSVVTKDVPPYSIVVGNPAKVLRFRFNDAKIEEILNLEWWDWDKEELKKNIEIFKENINMGEDVE